jgi:hypothetical protein
LTSLWQDERRYKIVALQIACNDLIYKDKTFLIPERVLPLWIPGES